MFEIEELKSINKAQITNLQSLMCELAPDIRVSASVIKNVVASPNSHLFVIKDQGSIIGCASLGVYISPTGKKASIEDVVISSNYRGHGLGRRLLEYMIAYTKEQMKDIDLHLTSNPNRKVANCLYKAIGFELRNTNEYQMSIRSRFEWNY